MSKYKYIRDCPICGGVFETNYLNKVYCDAGCRLQSQMVREQEVIKQHKEEMSKDTRYFYNPDNGKFYLKCFMQKETSL